MSSLKFNLPQMDYTTRFSLWQLKIRVIIAQTCDLMECLKDLASPMQRHGPMKKNEKIASLCL
jgi:hypothetical protein